MSRVVPLGILIAFMYILSNLLMGVNVPQGAGITLALGFIVLTAYVSGVVFDLAGLPKITGYMIVGVLFGPQVMGLVSKEVVVHLKLIDNIALGLIAFSAGREMNLKFLRRFFRSVLSITFWVSLLEFVGIGTAVWFLSAWWKPLNVPPDFRLPLALIFGLLAMAKSPITTIAVIEETGIRNRFSHTILGVVITKDILLVVFFSLISAFIQHWISPNAVNNLSIGFLLSWKLLGSMAGGVILGFLISLYVRWIKVELGLFIVMTAFLATEFAHQTGLEPLLFCMSAGIFIENISLAGESFLEGLKPSSPLIYTVFFAIAGAHLDLVLLKQLWIVVVVLLLLRTLLTQLGINLGSRLVEDDPQIRRYAWMGMINQAGVTLVLAMHIGKIIPEVGKVVTPVALGMIAATDFFAPALFKWGLRKCSA